MYVKINLIILIGSGDLMDSLSFIEKKFKVKFQLIFFLYVI